MDSTPRFVDKVKAEKAKAALRYRRTNQFKTIMHVLEACVALLLFLSWCSSSSLSLAVDAVVERSLRLLHLFRKPLSVFLLSNVIIVVIALLSGTGDRKRKTGPAADFSERIYDEYLSRRGTAQVFTGLHRPMPEKTPEETPANNLHIIPYVADPKLAESPKPIEPKASRVMAAEKEERHYRRTRSALAVRPRGHADDRALRRSMTENERGDTARSMAVRTLVDDLSDEDFNQTVENYIARTRCFLQRELMADLPTVPKESHGCSNMAVIVRN